MRILIATLALVVPALTGCGLIDARNGDNGSVDCSSDGLPLALELGEALHLDETCFCREPDETEEGASCVGGREACECIDGFIGCVEGTPCTIEYGDGGCGALDCICNVLGDSDGCTCSGDSCISDGEDNSVRSDLGGGCIGASCECIGSTCTCEVEAACRLETQGVLCEDSARCELFAGGESTGCLGDGDCDSDEVCVVVGHAEIGSLGFCFLVSDGDGCSNGGNVVDAGDFGASSAFCPRPTGLERAVCEGGVCSDVIPF